MAEPDENCEPNLTSEEVLHIIDRHFATASRGDANSLDGYLSALDKRSLEDTSTTIHCHFVQLDGNQRPKSDALARFLVDLVIDYAIPRQQIVAAHTEYTKTGSSQKWSALKRKAKALFVDLASNSGEGGEILLFALAERYLRLPQIICKMPLKTNSNVHFHGIDGVHAEVDEAQGKLALYWGESKLHKTIESALSDCFDSIEEFLNSAGATGARSQRDIDLIRDNVSLTDARTQTAILAMLDEDHALYNKIEYRAICLVGFDFDEYPENPMEKTLQQVHEAVLKAQDSWKEKVGRRVKKKMHMTSFAVEVLLLPFPNVEKFRESFVKELQLS